MNAIDCTNCGTKIYNNNKMFCSKECQLDEMRKKGCMGCLKNFHQENSPIKGYCSLECFEKMKKWISKGNFETLLGIGIWGMRDYSIISLKAIVKNTKNGNLEEICHDFEDLS